MNHPTRDGDIKPGEFPFPLTGGQDESRFLTWLRNHSNYMAVRGPLDYVRIAAVLVRGILVNNLVLLPGLLAAALVLGLVYGTLLDDWDDQRVPTEELKRAAEDYRMATGQEAREEKQKIIRQEQEKLAGRIRSVAFEFFWTKVVVKKEPFTEADFGDLPSLADKLTLTQSSREIDRWIAGRLEPTTRKALAAYNETRSDNVKERALKAALYAEFNLLLHDPTLYSKDRFDGITLRPETEKLIEHRPSSRAIAVGGFTDFPSLARKLNQPQRKIDQWIAEQLAPRLRKELAEYPSAGPIPAQLPEHLAIFFAGIIRGPSIYASDRFAHIDFRPKTERLLRDTPTKENVEDNQVRLNRLLIEEAYPLDFWWKVGGIDLVCLNHLLLDDAYPVELGRDRHRHGWVKWMQDKFHVTPPFIFTPIFSLLAALFVLAFPIVTSIARIAGFKRSLNVGSESSVKSRDGYERAFGAVLLVVVAVAVGESLPLLVNVFHQFRTTHRGSALPWKEYLATATAILCALSGAQKLLSQMTGVWKKLAMVTVGLLGLLVPFMVVIAVTDFMVYFPIPATNRNMVLSFAPMVVTPFIYAVLIVVVIVVGNVKRTFSLRENWRLFLLLVAIVVGHLLLAGGIWGFLGFLMDPNHHEYFPEMFLNLDPTTYNQANHPGPFGAASLSVFFVVVSALEVWLFCWLTVDVNLTSVHGLYRDRLASAYLLGLNRQGRVAIEKDVPLGDLSCHATRSTAPYHLINVALNLQGSKDISLRDRQSDFFIFSKKYIGGARTGYCRTGTMQRVFPQVDLASAMAISAAAASPNMGRGTSPLLVPFMTMINVRLGVWIPNPGVLEEAMARPAAKQELRETREGRQPGFTFEEVFRDELSSIQQRWAQLGPRAGRCLAQGPSPTPAHGLAGIGFSGGGIRSATINLGIAQSFHAAGIFEHFDYMSTVSGGGYLGSSISLLMRDKTTPYSEIAGKISIQETGDEKIVTVTPAGSPQLEEKYAYARGAVLEVNQDDEVGRGTRLVRRAGAKLTSDLTGTIRLRQADGQKIVTVVTAQGESREYRFSRYDDVVVEDGAPITAGQPLALEQDSFGQRFKWRVRPIALLREMTMHLNETYDWVNLSDGGHIENLASIELLRRRCKIIVIGDGEADPALDFNGLATLMRTASIDLGIQIDICLDDLRLNAQRQSQGHIAIGRINYPGEHAECGYLLYLKSSCTGDENEVIGEYRHRNTDFPHESTADQFFDEGQFEAYRALGEHIGQSAIRTLAREKAPSENPTFTLAELDGCFKAICARQGKKESKAATT